MIESGDVTGALVLLRDVTDLRSRDRLLISKDASIREVHHRIKNNLQTISSLLRLQGRRLPRGGGRTALEEAERRIRSIALVHEILSRDAIQQVDFREIIGPLVRMAQEGVLSERAVHITVDGDAGVLPADMATPLAMAVTELLQNAVEHAFPNGDECEPGTASARPLPDDQQVGVQFDSQDGHLLVTVTDNGCGLPEGFTIDGTSSLGLSIVRDLVRGQLGGSIEMSADDGTRAELRIPFRQPST
jgi:two-component sensor histidine kinase